MKVTFISSGLKSEYGGSAQSEATLCEELNSQVELSLFCAKNRYEKRKGLPNPTLFSKSEVVSAWFFHRAPWYSTFQQSQIVHINGHWKWENYFWSLLCRRHGIPYVLHPRGMLWVGHRKVWLKKLFNFLIGNSIVNHAKYVVALSQFEIRQFKPYFLSENQIRVIPNGITAPAKEASASKQDYFLYLGRLEKRKKLDYLISAFSDYRSHGGTHFLCLVGPIEHHYDKKLKSLVRHLGIEPFVKFVEPTYDSSKWKWMSEAKAVVYPGYEEAFGRVPFEALLAGSLPIVPKSSGSAEYLSSYFKDYFFSLDDQSTLSQVFLKTEKAAQEDSVNKGKSWVLQHLNPYQITQIFIRLYESSTSTKQFDRKNSVAQFK
jgi:glycosyltransferase involved in cell wall biosynthesis